jgi:acetyltransferase-like isoleucine patch superfamily enzyme
MGADCSIQCYAVLVGYGEDGEIRLGTGVRIAPHVTMIAGDHIFKDNDRPIREQGLRRKPITIEDDVWIAGRVTIVAGVTIGRGSVIGAGAVVTGDIAPGSIAVGIPAKVIRVRDGFTES